MNPFNSGFFKVPDILILELNKPSIFFRTSSPIAEKGDISKFFDFRSKSIGKS